MAKYKNFDDYISQAEKFAQPLLMFFRECVREACPEATEEFKWSMPNFVYNGSILCHMASFKKHASFSFWLASKMSDPNKIFIADANTGMGQFGKVTSMDQMPSREVLVAYIHEAMELIDSGEKLEVAAKKGAKVFTIPEDMQQALISNSKAKAVFDAFSQSNKNEYTEWITDAKTDTTRQKRMTQMLEWLEEGKPRNWKYMKAYQ